MRRVRSLNIHRTGTPAAYAALAVRRVILRSRDLVSGGGSRDTSGYTRGLGPEKALCKAKRGAYPVLVGHPRGIARNLRRYHPAGRVLTQLVP
jgi:hypothetical protein